MIRRKGVAPNLDLLESPRLVPLERPRDISADVVEFEVRECGAGGEEGCEVVDPYLAREEDERGEVREGGEGEEEGGEVQGTEGESEGGDSGAGAEEEGDGVAVPGGGVLGSEGVEGGEAARCGISWERAWWRRERTHEIDKV